MEGIEIAIMILEKEEHWRDETMHMAIMSNTGGDAVRRMRINDIQRDVDNIRLALDALRKVDV
jgi:hypothetical protein